MNFTSTTFSYSKDTSLSGNAEGNDIVFGMAIEGNGSEVTIDFEDIVFEYGDQMSRTCSMSTGYAGDWSMKREE